MFRYPCSSLEVHLVPFLQIQDDAETGMAYNDKLAVSLQVCSNCHVFIVETPAELVGSVLRSDEFPVIGVVVIVNVAASDVGDDLVELHDAWKRRMKRKSNSEVNI